MSDLAKACVAVQLLYSPEAAKSLLELGREDREFALRLAAAALDPKLLEEKHRIDAGLRHDEAILREMLRPECNP